MKTDQFVTGIIETDKIGSVKDQIHDLYEHTDNGIIIVDPTGVYKEDTLSLGGIVIVPDDVDVFTNCDRDNGDWMYYVFCLVAYAFESYVNRPLSETELDFVEGAVIRSMIKEPSGSHVVFDIKRELSDHSGFESLEPLFNEPWFNGSKKNASFDWLGMNRLVCLDLSNINDDYRSVSDVFSIACCQRLKDRHRQLRKEVNIFYTSGLESLTKQMPFLMDRLFETEESGK